MTRPAFQTPDHGDLASRATSSRRMDSDYFDQTESLQFEIDCRIAEALEAINSTTKWSEGWDVHRWGFRGHRTLVGDVFPTALIAEALQNCGWEIPQAKKVLLERRSASGWVYFPDLHEMPPDIDDLGQVLQVLGEVGPETEAGANCESSIAVLLENCRSDGSMPTWLARSTDERSTIAARWMGNECLTATATAYSGLLTYGGDRFGELIRQGLQHVLGSFAPHEDWGGYWHVPAYSRYVVTRLLVQIIENLDIPADQQEAANRCLSLTQNRMINELRKEVNLANPLETALATSTLQLLGGPIETVWLGVDALLASQLPDGFWKSEALCLTPTRGGGLTWYGSKSVTTAFCVRTLCQFLAKEYGTAPLAQVINQRLEWACN